MSLKEKSPPQRVSADGLGARGWSSHSARFVPKISDTPSLRQVHSHNPLWQRSVRRRVAELVDARRLTPWGSVKPRPTPRRFPETACWPVLGAAPRAGSSPAPATTSLSVSVRRVEMGKTRAGSLNRNRGTRKGYPGNGLVVDPALTLRPGPQATHQALWYKAGASLAPGVANPPTTGYVAREEVCPNG